MLIHLQCQVVNGVVNWVLLEVLRWYHLPQTAHILADTVPHRYHVMRYLVYHHFDHQINHMNFSSPPKDLKLLIRSS